MSRITTVNKIFLLPYWLLAQLEHAKRPLTTTTDFAAIAQVCSSEDLALIYQLNQDPSAVFGGMAAKLPTDLPMTWATTANESFQRVLELLPMAPQKLHERLFTKESHDAAYPEEFELRDLGDGVNYVIIYPGYFVGQDAVYYSVKLVRTIMKQLYGSSNFDSMARVPLFQQYLAAV